MMSPLLPAAGPKKGTVGRLKVPKVDPVARAAKAEATPKKNMLTDSRRTTSDKSRLVARSLSGATRGRQFFGRY